MVRSYFLFLLSVFLHCLNLLTTGVNSRMTPERKICVSERTLWLLDAGWVGETRRGGEATEAAGEPGEGLANGTERG